MKTAINPRAFVENTQTGRVIEAQAIAFEDSYNKSVVSVKTLSQTWPIRVPEPQVRIHVVDNEQDLTLFLLGHNMTANVSEWL
jgi:hypothetical protein